MITVQMKSLDFHVTRVPDMLPTAPIPTCQPTCLPSHPLMPPTHPHTTPASLPAAGVTFAGSAQLCPAGGAARGVHHHLARLRQRPGGGGHSGGHSGSAAAPAATARAAGAAGGERGKRLGAGGVPPAGWPGAVAHRPPRWPRAAGGHRGLHPVVSWNQLLFLDAALRAAVQLVGAVLGWRGLPAERSGAARCNRGLATFALAGQLPIVSSWCAGY